MKEARKIFKSRVHFSENDYDVLRGADALAVVTEWSEFRNPDFQKIKKLLKKPLIFDGRNIYNKAELVKMGFTYYSIGRQ
jgi:UDPglucose 6-dehydrogenase